VILHALGRSAQVCRDGERSVIVARTDYKRAELLGISGRCAARLTPSNDRDAGCGAREVLLASEGPVPAVKAIARFPEGLFPGTAAGYIRGESTEGYPQASIVDVLLRAN
jgi:hypothetical protein